MKMINDIRFPNIYTISFVSDPNEIPNVCSAILSDEIVYRTLYIQMVYPPIRYCART